MFTWLRLLVTPARTVRRQLMAFQDVIDALDKRVSAHYQEHKELRGKVYAMKRLDKSPEDAPGETIETPDITPGPRPVAPTAHLARRFRGG